jgi:cytochrome P450
VKSNASKDFPPEQRISDEDILHNINTFMFAGSDTSSLSLTWTLLLLAQNPAVQERLRAELLPMVPTSQSSWNLDDEEIQSLYEIVSTLPYLHNVTRESLRLIPPVHSTIRVATQDDEIPTLHPVQRSDGTIAKDQSVIVPKGSFVHVAVEGFNLDKDIWGNDAWEFKSVVDFQFRTLSD